MTFKLAEELARDSYHIADWPLCDVRVMNDRQFPWFLLVPKVAGVTEFIDLNEDDQVQLLRESRFLCHWLKAEYSPDKLNVAALGNQVPQLHLHHIARFHADCAWPSPVWGKQAMLPLEEGEVARLQSLFSEITF